MPIALPSDAAERYRLDSNTTSAYNVCRDLEEHAANHGTIQDLINARNIRLLIIYSPTITAQHNVVNVIHSCSKSPCFLELEMPTGLQVASMNAIKVGTINVSNDTLYRISLLH